MIPFISKVSSISERKSYGEENAIKSKQIDDPHSFPNFFRSLKLLMMQTAAFVRETLLLPFMSGIGKCTQSSFLSYSSQASLMSERNVNDNIIALFHWSSTTIITSLIHSIVTLIINGSSPLAALLCKQQICCGSIIFFFICISRSFSSWDYREMPTLCSAFTAHSG